jgi:glycosyltransferase involved in cell wall biosynthesis
MTVSVIIPTFNGANRIGDCLDALLKQTSNHDVEILVVDDGSTDITGDVVRRYSGSAVRLISQSNAGPGAARNRGATEARGEIILFTDDDCVPMPDWLNAMIRSFDDVEIVGGKGVYRTRQKSMIARFVQIEYEDRYRLMAGFPTIDFVDTYSAGFRRDRFLGIGGYDTSFPVACAEDIELSYRMSRRGWKMKFVPDAIVYHTHPDTVSGYLKKKYKFAFWRMLAVRKNPNKAVKDSHTPQLMKLQLLLAPALCIAVALDLMARPPVSASVVVLAAFFLSTIPFAMRAAIKDPVIGLISSVLLGSRACTQVAGVIGGAFYSWRKPAPGTSKMDHLDENLAAVDVHLTTADLREIETAFSQLKVHGGRMSEKHMQQLRKRPDA